MSSLEDYSGLCGIIPTFAHSGLQIRCTYELGHGGPCSFEKYRRQFYSWAGSNGRDYKRWYLNKEDDKGVKQGFIESVLSTALYDHHSVMITSNNEFKIRK